MLKQKGLMIDMKILNRLKTDAKILIHELRDMNDSLINTIVDYQDVIFGQRETVKSLEDIIALKDLEINRLKQEIERLKGDKCDG